MKKCPVCDRLYDDSQSFCLEDGTALVTVSTTNLQETLVLPRRKSKFPIIFGGLLLLAGTLLGGWLLLGLRANETNQSNRQTTVVTPKPVLTPRPTPTETPTPLPAVSPTFSPEANSSVSTNSVTNAEIAANSKPADEINQSKPLPTIMKTEDHSISFALHECRKSGSSITCLFSLTNKGADREFQLWGYRSELFDELGNGYKGSDAQIANQTGRSPSIGFINGVTTQARMTFENVEPNAVKITLLSIGFNVGKDERLSVNFRNVPLIVSK